MQDISTKTQTNEFIYHFQLIVEKNLNSCYYVKMDQQLSAFLVDDTCKISIISLDDDETIGYVLGSLFSQRYSHRHALTSADFFEMIRQEKPDLVLIDLHIGEEDGLDVCRRMNVEYGLFDVQKIILTGDDSEQTVKSAYESGASDYIRKPFYPVEIEAKINHFAENIQFRKNLTQLYNGVRLFSKKLFKLTRLINANINGSSRQDILSSLRTLAGIIGTPFSEAVFHEAEGNNYSFLITPDSNAYLSYERLCELRPEIISGHAAQNHFSVKRREGTLQVYAFRLDFDPLTRGTLLFETYDALAGESIELVTLYLDFMALKGSDMLVHEKLAAELRKDRHELSKVRSIQVQLIPDFEELGGYDVGYSYIPIDEISGDFLDAFFINNSTYQFVVCDVSGHGFASSFIGSYIRAVIRSISAEVGNPATIMTTLNKIITHTLSRLNYFATIVLWQVNTENGITQMVSAGHPPVMKYDEAQGCISLIENTGPMIGLFQEAEFEMKEITMNTDDMFIVYTDGLFEAMSPENKLFGTKNLAQSFESAIRDDSLVRPNDIIHSVLGTVYQYTDYMMLEDDVTVLCVRKRDV